MGKNRIHSEEEGLCRLTYIIDGPISGKNQPRLAVSQEGSLEVSAGAEIEVATLRSLNKAIRSNQGLLSSVLLRTNGGSIIHGQPVLYAIKTLRREGVSTTAFVDSLAASYGAIVLAHCNARIGRKDSTVMWHQAYLLGENQKLNTAVKPELLGEREVFRRELQNWLLSYAAPEHQHCVLKRLENAFSDPENHLDDVLFSGKELRRVGILDKAVYDRRALGVAYAKTMRSSPKDWPLQVQRFFHY